MPGAAAADFPAVVAACVRCGRPPLYMSGAGPQRTHKADGSAGRACLKVIQVSERCFFFPTDAHLERPNSSSSSCLSVRLSRSDYQRDRSM